ncbi:MFS transporter [soil metagenome]
METSFRGQYRLLIPVLAVVFIAALDLTVVAPILPSMIVDLDISAVDADRYAWIVLSYLVAYTVTVPITGRISDYAGRIPVFGAALLLFVVGSVVAASADSLGVMVTGRTLQGLGGGAMLPVSMALVADVVPINRRAAALGLVAAVDTFGWVLGPVWGAAINELFDSWRAVFWLNIPICAVAAVFLVTAGKRFPSRSQSQLPNFASAALAAIGLVTVTLALSSGSEGAVGPEQGGGRLGASSNPMAPFAWYLLVLGLISLIAFIFSERRSKSPLLPLELIRQRMFQLAAAANIMVGAALIVAMVNAPLIIALLADEDRVSTLTALLLGSFTLTMTAGALTGGRVVHRFGTRLVATIGLIIGALGFFSMYSWTHELDLTLMSMTIAVAGLGLGIVIAPLAESAIASAGVGNYGSASGLVLLARLLGMTFGLAAITRYGLDRLDTKVAGIEALPPQSGESTSAYFIRQQEYLDEQVIPFTLDVIHETFLIAGVLCLVTILIVSRMRRHSNVAGG